MTPGDEHDVRMSRVAKSLRDIIANRITRGLGDVPRGPVTITRVEVTRDFKLAKVFVSIFSPEGASHRERDELIDRVFAALESASVELVRETNKQLRLKNTPKFEFVLDTGLQKMARIATLLDSVKSADQGESPLSESVSSRKQSVEPAADSEEKE
jgi:ribosome-binding factor A